MDILFFIFTSIGIVFGCLNIALLILLKDHSEDRGVWTLLLPLAPLTGITFLELLDYYLQSRNPEEANLLFSLLYEWGRIAIAFGWNFIACYHYALNRVGPLRRSILFVIIGLCVLLFLAVPIVVFAMPEFMSLIHVVVVAMLYFAGIRGIFIIRKGRKLLPSSVTAVIIAGISLVAYPVIAIGDLRGWRIALLDPDMNFWVQAHPVYFFLVNIPLLFFLLILLRSFFNPPLNKHTDLAELATLLTRREYDVLYLLYEGYRYAEIADKLFLSLATVKTHVQHIYQKLGIKRREELFINFRYSGRLGS